MTTISRTSVRSLHPSPEYGILDCPDCNLSILGSYTDLILHYLDAHPISEQEDRTAAGQRTLIAIKRAQAEAQLQTEGDRC